MKISHDEVYKLAASFGTALQQMGLKRGDIVAILLPNCPQFAPIMHGMFMTGIVASPMNPALTPRKVFLWLYLHAFSDKSANIAVFGLGLTMQTF